MNYSKIKSIFSNQFAMTFIILILLFLMLIIKQNVSSSDFKELISFSNDINKINTSNIEKSNLSSKSFTDKLTDSINNLNSIKKSLTELDVSDKYNKHKKLLLEGVKKNIELYNNIKSMLENPSNDNLSSKNKETIALKKETVNIYKQCNELKLPVTLGKDSNSLSYSALDYINEILKINRDKDILEGQIATYRTQIDNIYNKFALLNEDLFTIIDLMKSENRSLSTLLDDINSKIENFKLLKEELYSLSVPIEFLDSFDSLKNVFSKYDLYINSLRNYVLQELNSGDGEKLLEESKSLQDELNSSIEDFQRKLSAIHNN